MTPSGQCIIVAAEERLGIPETLSSSASENATSTSTSQAGFSWSSCLSDDSNIPPLPRRGKGLRSHWVQSQSKSVVAAITSGATFATASNDGTVTLFRSAVTIDTCSSPDVSKKPGLGKRKVSDRSQHGLPTIMSPGTVTRPRKASATVSLQEVDASAPTVQPNRGNLEAAVDALGAVSPPSPEIPTPHATDARSLDESQRSRRESISKRQSRFPSSAATLRAPLQPFAQIRVMTGFASTVNMLLSDRADAALLLSSDGYLHRISLIDGLVEESVNLGVWEEQRSLCQPKQMQIIEIASVVYVFVFTFTSLIVAVDVTSMRIVSHLALPVTADSIALCDSRQGDLYLAYTASACLSIHFLPLVPLTSNGISATSQFVLATPHHPIQLDFAGSRIDGLMACGKDLLCCSGGDIHTLRIDEQVPMRSSQSARNDIVQLLASSPKACIVRCKDEHTRVIWKRNYTSVASFPAGQVDSACFVTDEVGFLSVLTEGIRLLHGVHLDGSDSISVLFASQRLEAKPYLCQSLMLSTLHLLGFSTGHVGIASFEQQIVRASQWTLGARVSCLAASSAATDGQNARFAVGTANGAVAVFTSDLKLLQRWSAFASPVCCLSWLEHPNVVRFNGRLVAISADCTTAFLDLSQTSATIMSFPGAKTPLRQIRILEDDLYLVYASGLWRQWDSRSGELRRSAPEPLLDIDESSDNKGWILSLDEDSLTGETSTEGISFSVKSLLRPVNDDETLKDFESRAKGRLTLMSTILNEVSPQRTRSHDLLLQKLKSESLGPSRVFMLRLARTIRYRRLLVPQHSHSNSARMLALRLLPTLAIYKFLQNFPEIEHAARNALELLVSSCPLEFSSEPLLLDAFAYLAGFWNHAVPELQSSARALIESNVARLSREVVLVVATRWHSNVFARSREMKPDVQTTSTLLLALVVIQHFDVVEEALLLATAHGIADFLTADDHDARLLAIELFGRGLQLWQNQLDVSPCFSTLIDVAFAEGSGDTDANDGLNEKQAARHTLLQAVTTALPQLLNAMSLDALHTVSTKHHIAVLRLIVLIVRKKPLVMLASVPRLVEATVKSLDPLSRTSRSTLQPMATYLLQELVKTYPTVSFHESTQKLAVGTHEGALVMYDVKSATRLYVLDFHRKPVTAVSLAADGRRLVTVALEESRIAVWKVGTSFLGMLNAGGPPRQGTQGSRRPYQTYNFGNVVNEDALSGSALLHLVAWDWPTERTARLRVREAAMTFNTA